MEMCKDRFEEEECTMNTKQVVDPENFPKSLSDSRKREIRNQYDRDGYVAFNGVLTDVEVAKTQRLLSDLVLGARKQRRDYVMGVELTRAMDQKNEFYIQYESGTDKMALTDQNAEEKVRKLMHFVNQDPFFQFIAYEHPRVKALIEMAIGESFILFQEMALVKPAFIGGERAWHQDDSYFAVKPLEAVAGIWIALDNATAANGCMHVIRGAHRKGPLLQSTEVGCTIAEGRIDKEMAQAIELRPGGAMVLSGLLPHFTPRNTSPNRRRSIQYHYRSFESEIVSKAEYNTLFREHDGTPAACSSWQYKE